LRRTARMLHHAMRRPSLRAFTVLGASALIVAAIAFAPGFANRAHAQYPWARSSPSVVGTWPAPGPAAFPGYSGTLQPSATQRGSQARAASTTPHPAVARIIVDAGSSISYGSGTLVDITDQHGLVLTNWHVVRDAPHNVQVQFPGGFRSAARVAKYDKDWDLAALVIWRPPVEPVRLSANTPQVGDALSIAGYGSGNYRQGDGRCTQFVAPGTNFPFDMVEVSVEARQGDSGGPILNSRGELAGVLFGASWGTTAGSHVGRVRQFLANVAPELSTPTTEHIARAPNASDARDAVASSNAGPSNSGRVRGISNNSGRIGGASHSPGRQAGVSSPTGARREVLEIVEPPSDILADAATSRDTAGGGTSREIADGRSSPTQRWADPPPTRLGPGLTPQPLDSGATQLAGTDRRPNSGTDRTPTADINAPPLSPDLPPAALPAAENLDEGLQAKTITWRDLAGDTLFDQAKTLLAVVGLLSLLVFSLRLSAK